MRRLSISSYYHISSYILCHCVTDTVHLKTCILPHGGLFANKKCGKYKPVQSVHISRAIYQGFQRRHDGGGGYTRRWGTSIFYLHKLIIPYTAVRCYKNLVLYPHFKASGYFITTVNHSWQQFATSGPYQMLSLTLTILNINLSKS